MLKGSHGDDSDTTPSEPRPSLTELFNDEEARLVRFACGIVRRRSVAEELVQEGFLRLHKHWDEVEKPRPWVYRAVRNLALSHLRDNKREFETDDGVADCADEKDTPDRELGRMEAVGMVRLLLDELEHPDGELVRRKYLEGQSYKEISEAVGLTVSNVGFRLHHALKSLALSLRRAGIEGLEG
jgi:RNA polymerase sigma factor (sigma-70 family)